MAKAVIEFDTTEFVEKVKRVIRHALITGEIGEWWVEFCDENQVSLHTKLQFLDFLNKKIDGDFEC